MIVVYLLLLMGFGLLLIKAADMVTDSLQELAGLTHLGRFAVTSLLVALATSIPELTVSISAALAHNPEISLGVILGSNIANVSLVVGAAAIIGGTLSVAGQFLKFDVFSVFLAGALPLILMFDGQLSRVDGIILLLIYVIFNYGILKEKPRDFGEAGGRFKLKILNNSKIRKRVGKGLIWLGLGVALLIFSGDMLINIAVNLAEILKVPVFLIGMFLIAIGATVPELTFEARAIKKHQAGMVLGNLLGSVVVNSTLILGMTALIYPIKLSQGINGYLLGAAAFGVMFILFWQLVKTKKKLERWEGAILVGVYLVFMAVEWVKR